MCSIAARHQIRRRLRRARKPRRVVLLIRVNHAAKCVAIGHEKGGDGSKRFGQIQGRGHYTAPPTNRGQLLPRPMHPCVTAHSPAPCNYTGNLPNSSASLKNPAPSPHSPRSMNPLTWFRTSRDGGRQPAAHMTWAHSSVGRSISRTGVFLKRQIWIWPIIAVVLLSIIGFFVRRSIESTMRDGLKSQLETTRRSRSRDARDLVPRAEVERRIAGQRSSTSAKSSIHCSMQTTRTAIAAQAKPTTDVTAAHAKLEKSLGPAMTAHDYTATSSPTRRSGSSPPCAPELIGQQDIPEYEAFLLAALDGTTNVSAAVRQRRGDQGRNGPHADRRADDVRRRADPRREFPGRRRARSADRSREGVHRDPADSAAFGESGETYAFDKNGLHGLQQPLRRRA